MKLLSSKGKGKHVAKPTGVDNSRMERKSSTANSNKPGRSINTGTEKQKGSKKRWSTGKKVLVIFACFIGLVLIFTGSVFAIIWWEVQPFYNYFFIPGADVLAQQPVLKNPVEVVYKDPENPDIPTHFIDDEGNLNEITDISDFIEFEERKEHIMTFLVLGIDLHGNTDVIMVASFNSEESTLDVVSIPRDTLVNVPWNLKKVNSIHASARNTYRSEDIADGNVKDATFAHFRNILGFHLDFMITISMGGFPRIVNAVGGIEFDVPVSINLEGVRISRGKQRLNGEQALIVMRARNEHSAGDIGRANTQQEFLNTFMKQTLANRSSIKVEDMADIFLRHTNTNIQLNHLVGLGKEFLKIDAENINFHMMPGTFDPLRGDFFIAIQVEPWLKLVNERLSPLNREITETDVSILTRNSERKLYVTDGNWQGDSSWGAASIGPSNPQSTTDGYKPVD